MRDIRRKFGDPDRDEWAAKLHVSKNTLASYERGETEPTASVLATYRSELGISVAWIVTGSGEMFDDPSKIPQKPIAVAPAMVQNLSDKIDRMSKVIGSLRPATGPNETIKYLPLRASAGGGAVVLDESDGIDMGIDMLAENLLGVRRRNILLLEIKGDSMEPTLQERDIVVVDTSDPKTINEPDENRVYIVSIEGELFAKRARWQPDFSLHWCSDNERYAPISVIGDDFNRIKTIGRVVWLWRTV